MTEDDAREWIVRYHGDRAVGRIAQFLDMVIAENGRQNLIAPSTIATIWVRHALDSAQLLRFDQAGLWIDIGTGGGFPGMIVALLRNDPVLMVEPRARRTAFLQTCVDAFALRHAEVVTAKAERITSAPAAVISARAVATIPTLVQGARHLASRATRWVLPRGRSGQEDLDTLPRTWQGLFHVEHSIVDPQSMIAILDEVNVR